MKHIYYILFFLLATVSACTTLNPDDPGSSNYFDRVLKQEVVSKSTLVERVPLSLPSFITAMLPDREVSTDVIEYRMRDQKGEVCAASGLITYPANGDFKGVVVAQHYTFASDREVPSQRMAAIESLLSLFGY